MVTQADGARVKVVKDARGLPSGFEDLEAFVDQWSLPGTQERHACREAASIADIRRFYDAMLARAPAAIDFLDGKPFSGLADDEIRLMRLLLALGHVAVAVEVHGQPRAPHTPYPHRVRLSQPPRYFG
jgi:hypothetical protein